MAEAVEVRNPFSVAPYGTVSSRDSDKDHTERYQRSKNGGRGGGKMAGRRGQTGPATSDPCTGSRTGSRPTATAGA
jgi:hypothetical protein